MNNNIPPIWYSSSQAIICLFAALVLFSMWIRGEPKKGEPRSDKPGREPGLLWLASAVLVWAMISVWMLWTVWSGKADNIPIVRILSSTLNSAFFLLATAYFDYGPTIVKIFQRHSRWRLGVIAAAIFIAGVTLSLPKGIAVSIPDTILSIITLGFLGVGLFQSFSFRGFKTVSYLSCLAVLLTLIAQLPEIFPRLIPENMRWILLLTSKTMLITNLFALVISWAYEGWELPAAGEISLRFTGTQDGDGCWLVFMTFAGKFINKKILMTTAYHTSLLKFAVKRIRDELAGDGWMNLETASLWHQDIKRICTQLGIPISVIFENNKKGGYRLRVPAKNIKIDQEEFTKHQELKKILVELNPTQDQAPSLGRARKVSF